MPEFDVHWVTSGVTRVWAQTEKDAARALYDYPFSDDANAADVVDVVPTRGGR